MKPFGKILEEVTIESAVGFDETIAKLREQQGPCSDENSFGVRMWFSCTKKGAIRFTNSRGEYGYSIYFVEGRVVEQNGKTVVKIYFMENNVERIHRLIAVILGIALIIFGTIQAIKEKSLFTIETGGLLALWIFSIANAIHTTRLAKKNKEFNFEVCKKEIIERVEAIKRWND